MITDSIQNIAQYQGISPQLEHISRFLQNTDLRELPLGRTDLDGDLLYVNHMVYTTASRTEQDLYEDHQRYWDLHLILSGHETVAVAPSETLDEVRRCEEEDFALYRGDVSMEIPLREGNFLLLHPGEGHLPKLSSDGEMVQVDKLVFKLMHIFEEAALNAD